MKFMSLGAACLLAATFNVVSAVAHAAESAPPERYHYGMHLDVKKVIAVHEEPSVLCQVVDARMDYLDSSGQLRSLEYRKHADVCSNEN
ncbi:DUF2790 domain-containing protein [Pseudomonas sp. Q1-7]|uniref:DUF2790 domain-containing protein n=1 Tax=Pseudomonas sp. Q1-7 TaxID=3020843 RepID=UPI0023000EEA|nr:DUF2790 domain-containing protein [Pseudomonas sp. Q1-7]